MTDKTGGAAFPVPATELHGTDTGMTLQDYFAAKAMQSLITHFDYGCIGFNERYMNEFAKEAYQMADAMLKARG
ncbi:hypothetical protein [Providencia rettgeri]|uniref:hypothetical protein n=1 Tax=Providencia rettgeri TaxID=587 RepID=UPI0032EC068A